MYGAELNGVLKALGVDVSSADQKLLSVEDLIAKKYVRSSLRPVTDRETLSPEEQPCVENVMLNGYKGVAGQLFQSASVIMGVEVEHRTL